MSDVDPGSVTFGVDPALPETDALRGLLDEPRMWNFAGCIHYDPNPNVSVDVDSIACPGVAGGCP